MIIVILWLYHFKGLVTLFIEYHSEMFLDMIRFYSCYDNSTISGAGVMSSVTSRFISFITIETTASGLQVSSSFINSFTVILFFPFYLLVNFHPDTRTW